MEGIKIKTPLGVNFEDLFEPTESSIPSWKDNYPFNTPVQGGVMPVTLQQELIDTIRSLFPESLKVEVWSEGNSVRFKVREEFNESFFRGAVDYPYLNSVKGVLSSIREGINNRNKKFKRCKVFYLDYENEPETNSFNVVYSPRWRKYENYEIFFRSKTQLRRSRER